MGDLTTSRLVWRLVERQHGVVAHRQLVALGLSPKAIKHRVRTGKLRPLWRGVYAVGRRSLTRAGWWMAAVLACGDCAALSHASAASLWTIRPEPAGPIHVSVPRPTDPRHDGIRVHRRLALDAGDLVVRNGIRTTGPVRTLIDIAPSLTPRQLEAAVNEADKLGLVSIEALRRGLEGRRDAGAPRLRKLIDRATFVLTDTELERLFVPLARRAGLPKPRTQVVVNRHRVDFHWPGLRLVVETDGGRFHRTALQQTRDRLRDQAHAAAGLVPLRFTHGQVRYEPEHVVRTLRAVAARLTPHAA